MTNLSNTPVPRNARIEALRLWAVVAIAVFHTFQPWLSSAACGSEAALGEAAPLAALGSIGLLGAFGNHVFFLISGLFLVPGCAARSREDGFWAGELRRLAVRAAKLASTVALWAACALAVSSWVTPIEGVALGQWGWLVGGLEFVWVYLVVVALSPAIGWAWARLRHPERVVWALVLATYAVNAYVAFVSPGSDVRGLLEWRKLLSAFTYLVSFVAGAALAGRSPGRPSLSLFVMALGCVAVEALLSLMGRGDLVVATSFKSTSLMSFLLAVTALQAARATSGGANPAWGGAARALAAHVLGFYVLQSVFRPLWMGAETELLAQVLTESGVAAFFALGCALSIALAAAALVADLAVGALGNALSRR